MDISICMISMILDGSINKQSSVRKGKYLLFVIIIIIIIRLGNQYNFNYD